MIQVFVPTGAISTAALKTAARADRTDFVVGMLDNHKHGTAEIFDRLQERLTAQFGGINFVRHKKADAGRGAGSKIIGDLANQCGVVINGVAD
jgi:hypothetical protein